jgi:colanic acid biosynthesis glycosyl transferase WcaI
MPTAYVLYHFFYPDDVISAVLFSQFAEELSRRGWDVTVISSNRYCRYPDRVILKKREIWKKVTIIRTYRPKFNQANSYLRLLNSLWMILAWTNQLLVMPEADAIIIGTDPQFSAFIFPLLRFFRRGKVLVHWVYDIFPEAIIADNPPRIYRYFLSILKRLTKFSYQFVDATVDIGPCMREILRNQYPACNNRATLVPWALAEPDKLLEPEQKTR